MLSPEAIARNFSGWLVEYCRSPIEILLCFPVAELISSE
jgi:hypothetical protein